MLKDGYTAGEMQITQESMETSDYLRSTTETNKRALMAKDVVRTIMAIAGVESDFGNYYVDNFYKDAQVIAALVGSD